MRGVDFRIAKTSKGGFADYSTSKWSRRERAISDADKAAIEQFGLHNLSDFLPKKPTDVELKVMKEMFEASVDGEAYDMERWGQYFKPAGMGQATGDPNKSAAPRAAVAAPVAASAVEEDAPWEEPATPAVKAAPAAPTGESASRAQDILAMIRNRQK
jgi:phage gp16-like protein